MSRYYEGDDYDVLSSGRWEKNSRAVLSSRRGQAALREIEQALLHLPAKRLIEGEFVKEDAAGTEEFCVLGAYAAYKGVEIPEWMVEPALTEPEYRIDPAKRWHDRRYLGSDGNIDDESRWAEKNLGMTFTLAWNLMYENDETLGRCTPEERYTRMLAWVRKAIRTEPAPGGSALSLNNETDARAARG